MKVKLLLIMFVLCYVVANAQQNECYSSRHAQGVELFKKGNYEMAKKYFNFAKSCAWISDDAKDEIQQWMQLCDDAIAGIEVQIPEHLNVNVDAPTEQEIVEQPKKPVNKAAERAKREAAERARREAIERGETIETPNAPAEQPQSALFAKAMHTADSCFNVADYVTAEMNYQIAAQEAQKAGNQNDVQTALKKIDCCQQLSQADDLMRQQKYDEARAKLVSVRAIGCIDPKRVQTLIDRCNDVIAQENDSINLNFIKPISEDMVLIKGGVFMMGCQSDCKEGETPVHQVVLRNFYMGKHEITQAQWEALMGYNHSTVKNKEFPVTNINYDEVQNFIVKLNAASGLTYRLPTESEWEFAARGGEKSNQTIYAGSNSAPYVAWFVDDSENTIHAVGLLTPNELDIYDMSGNVAEWCSDWYMPYTSDFHLYPAGAKDGTERVVRGGGYNDNIDFTRVTFRFTAKPETKSPTIGFRLASDGFE